MRAKAIKIDIKPVYSHTKSHITIQGEIL